MGDYGFAESLVGLEFVFSDFHLLNLVLVEVPQALARLLDGHHQPQSLLVSLHLIIVELLLANQAQEPLLDYVGIR